jgi:hypothetical protein
MTTVRSASTPIARPIAPMPMKTEAGFATAIYSGVSPKLTSKNMNVDIKFSSKAVSGGDLAAFMKVVLPANQGVVRNPPPAPVTVQVPFKNGDSAETQAKALEAALKAQAPAGYSIARKGNDVRITMRMMA